MKHRCVFPLLVSLLYSLEITNGKLIAVGRRYISDQIPSVQKMKSLSKTSERFCAIECAKSESCYSFSFRLGICNLWDAKYQIEDKLMENAMGHIYYHFDAMPEATELKVFKTDVTYDDAFRSCRTLFQGNLVVIHNEEMEKKLEDLMAEENLSDEHVWIGMNGTADGSGPKLQDGTFTKFDLRWVDGHVFTLGRYAPNLDGNPNVDGVTCWKRWGSGLWADRDCTENAKYVCQFALSG